MVNRYRLAVVATMVAAVSAALLGGLALWRPAWVALCVTLLLAQASRHYAMTMTVRGVDTVVQRRLKTAGAPVTQRGDGGEVATERAAAAVEDAVRELHEQRRLQEQALRHVVAETRLLQVQGRVEE